MRPHLLYFLGSPGSGKSTLVKELTGRWVRSLVPSPFAHEYIHCPEPEVVELGKRRDNFAGTDALAMNVITRVLSQCQMDPWPMLLGEGDRLATMKFFEPMRSYGYKVQVVYLDPPSEAIEEWRQKRAREVGKTQDPKWVAGRATKHRKLAEAIGAEVISDTDPSERFASLLRVNSPIIEHLVNQPE